MYNVLKMGKYVYIKSVKWEKKSFQSYKHEIMDKCIMKTVARNIYIREDNSIVT